MQDRFHEQRLVKIHDDGDFAAMRIAGRLAAQVLDFIAPHVVVGVSTETLDDLCHRFILDHAAVPAPLGYRGYPKSICTSVNHVVCHGIPAADKKLKNGDIINIDVTVIVDGWHGDTSRMFFVGDKKSVKTRRLVATTYDAMMAGIATVRPGACLGDIGHAIQTLAERAGYGVVRDFCGHGIGKVFHDAPSVMHFGQPGEGVRLAKGMFFTIEPMVNVGTHEVKILDDGWTAITKDRSLSAQFEHTIGVTDDGCEIFTLSPAGLDAPGIDASGPHI